MGFSREMLMLSKEELLLMYPLREKLSEENRLIVERVHKESQLGYNPIVNAIIQEALEYGKMEIRIAWGGYCPVCKRSGGYVKYKSGPNKGLSNLKRPILIKGYYVKIGSVSMRDTVHWCEECEKEHKIFSTITYAIEEGDLPIEFPGSKWKRYQGRKCHNCGKEMFENEMGKLFAIMGGEYPGVCPHCKAESRAFGRHHGITKKFKMVKEE